MNVIENAPGIPQPWTCTHGNTYPAYSLSTCSACRLREVEKADIGGYARGFAAGLDAAREAVDAQFRNGRAIGGPIEAPDELFAAIDALKDNHDRPST